MLEVLSWISRVVSLSSVEPHAFATFDFVLWPNNEGLVVCVRILASASVEVDVDAVFVGGEHAVLSS